MLLDDPMRTFDHFNMIQGLKVEIFVPYTKHAIPLRKLKTLFTIVVK